MTPEQRASHLRDLRNNPVLAEIIAGIEAAAIDAITFARPAEHDVRQAHASELRAIRAFRDTIMTDDTRAMPRTSIA